MQYGRMAAAPEKKKDSQRQAKAIYLRLMELPRPSHIDSNNSWTSKAGVSTSFFTNLQGSEKKPASEPSIGNLRRVLEAVGSSVPEFFLEEARGRLVRAPTRQAIEQALSAAMAHLPKRRDAQVAFLATVVLRALGLPDRTLAIAQDENQADRAEAPPARAATNRA